MKRIKRLLDDSSEAKIREAIRSAERKTSAEIVPMIVWESSPTFHVFPILFLILALLAAALAPWMTEFFVNSVPGWGVYALLTVAVTVLAIFFSRTVFFQRALTPDEFEGQMVERRALFEFYQSQMDATIAKTGVLIFVSVRERRAVVLADKTISTRVDPNVWNQVVESLTTTAHRSSMTEGIIAAVERVGELLSEQFPRGPHDVNELPDKLIVKV